MIGDEDVLAVPDQLFFVELEIYVSVALVECHGGCP